MVTSSSSWPLLKPHDVPRGYLVEQALNNAELAASAADSAGGETCESDGLALFTAQATAFGVASQAYSALLAVARDGDFAEE